MKRTNYTYVIAANNTIGGYVFPNKSKAIQFATELNRIGGFPVIVINETLRKRVFTVK